MTLLIILIILVALAAYFVISYKEMKLSQDKINKLKGEIISLYVKRANLMPSLMNAARKYEPVPMPIHSAFVAARDHFSSSGGDEDAERANLELTEVFSRFFAYYAGCGTPQFLVLKGEYEAIIEKINFNLKFLEAAYDSSAKINAGLPYGPAAAIIKLTKRLLDYLTAFLKGLKAKFEALSGKKHEI